LGLGGVHQVDNLEIACAPCNLTKSNLRLEDFIGVAEAEKWRRNGWPPPFKLLAKRPVAELWLRSPEVARRFARQPREVPFNPRSEWGERGSLDERIAEVLSRQQDPWRALALAELARRLGEKPGPLDQAWTNAMGMTTAPTRPGYADVRYQPSPYITPTRVRPRRSSPVGQKAFRLRFDFAPAARMADRAISDEPRPQDYAQDEAALDRAATKRELRRGR
jgi:hypothetical protein